MILLLFIRILAAVLVHGEPSLFAHANALVSKALLRVALAGVVTILFLTLEALLGTHPDFRQHPGQPWR